ncbi:MAG TPA: TolC family protein [Thermoanaerobaculia bacterium]
MNGRPFLVSVLLIALAVSALGEELSLQQAVAIALERSPAMRTAAAQNDVAAARLAEARSAWLPRVDVTESYGRSNNPVFAFGSLLEQGRFGQTNFDPRTLNSPETLTNWRIALNVRYTLFDQFRRMDSSRQAASAVEQSNSALEESRQRTRLEVLSRFYGVIVAEAKRDVATDAVKTAEADAKAMRDKFEQGLIVESDALSGEVQLAQFRQQQIEAEGELAIARAALNTVLRRDAEADVTPRGELVARALPEITLADALARGRAARGQIRSAALASDNARLQLQIARGSLLPRVDSYASWGASGQRISDRDNDRTVGVVASFDIFDPAKFARSAEARAGVQAASAGEAAARDQVSVEIVAAWQHVRSARERIDLAARAVAQAQAAARIVRDRYEQGLTTITEHLRAQSAVVSARLNLLAARYEYVAGYAELLRSTGGLHDVDLFS